MRVAYCDCCKAKIGTYEKIYSLEIKQGNDKEIVLDDVCEDCFDRFKSIIDNAERWGKSQSL